MFEVGDIIRVPGGKFNNRYQVIKIFDSYMVLRNLRYPSGKMDFNSNIFDKYILDEVYVRNKKLKKICSKLETK